MKTNFKEAIMPLAVVVLGATTFATNAVKQNEKADAAAMFGCLDLLFTISFFP